MINFLLKRHFIRRAQRIVQAVGKRGDDLFQGLHAIVHRHANHAPQSVEQEMRIDLAAEGEHFRLHFIHFQLVNFFHVLHFLSLAFRQPGKHAVHATGQVLQFHHIGIANADLLGGNVRHILRDLRDGRK